MPEEQKYFKDTQVEASAAKASDRQSGAHSDGTYLDKFVDLAWKKPEQSDGSPSAHDYAKGFLKTAALFMGSRVGMAGTVTLYALDQARPSDSLGAQAAEFGMGAAQGFVLRKSFDWFGNKDMNIALKGVGLGTTNRFIEHGLNTQTYLTPNGGIDIGGGLSKTWDQSVSWGNAASDASVFVLAGLGLRGMDKLGMGYMKESRLLNTMMTGATFGMSSGATAEFNRQRLTGEDLNIAKIAERSIIQGLIDTAAAGPGGLAAAVRPPNPFSAEISQQYRGRLGEYVKENRMIDMPIKGQKNFENWADYEARGVKDVETPVRVYSPEGHTGKVVVPEAYAAKLDQVRQWRDLSVQEVRPFGDLAGTLSILGARLKLDTSPFGQRMLPEELVKAFDQVPDRRLFGEVKLFPDYRHEGFYVEKRGGSTGTRAEVNPATGEMSFFGPRSEPKLFETSAHEWSHLAERKDPRAVKVFENTVKLEGEEAWVLHSYGNYNVHENWAVHMGEVIINGGDRSFQVLMGNAPLRTAILGRSMGKMLSEVPVEQRGANHDLLVSRVQQIETQVTPKAQEWLNGLLGSKSPETAQMAKEVLDYLKETKPAGT